MANVLHGNVLLLNLTTASFDEAGPFDEGSTFDSPSFPIFDEAGAFDAVGSFDEASTAVLIAAVSILRFPAAAAVILNPPQPAALIRETFGPGAAALTLPGLSVGGALKLDFQTTAAIPLPLRLTVSAAAVLDFDIFADVAPVGVRVAAAGLTWIELAGAITVPPVLVAAAVAVERFTSTSAVTLPTITVAANSINGIFILHGTPTLARLSVAGTSSQGFLFSLHGDIAILNSPSPLFDEPQTFDAPGSFDEVTLMRSFVFGGGGLLEVFAGPAALSLPGLSVAGVALEVPQLQFPMSGDIVLPTLSAAAVAVEDFDTFAGIAIPGVIVSAAVAADFDIAGAATLGRLTAAGTASEIFALSGDVGLRGLVVAGASSGVFTATAALTLPGPTVAIAGAEGIALGGAIILHALTVAAAATGVAPAARTLSGAIEILNPPPSFDAAAAFDAVGSFDEVSAMSALVVGGTFAETFSAAGVMTLAALSTAAVGVNASPQASTISGNVVLPVLRVGGAGAIEQFTATAALTLAGVQTTGSTIASVFSLSGAITIPLGLSEAGVASEVFALSGDVQIGVLTVVGSGISFALYGDIVLPHVLADGGILYTPLPISGTGAVTLGQITISAQLGLFVPPPLSALVVHPLVAPIQGRALSDGSENFHDLVIVVTGTPPPLLVGTAKGDPTP